MIFFLLRHAEKTKTSDDLADGVSNGSLNNNNNEVQPNEKPKTSDDMASVVATGSSVNENKVRSAKNDSCNAADQIPNAEKSNSSLELSSMAAKRQWHQNL